MIILRKLWLAGVTLLATNLLLVSAEAASLATPLLISDFDSAVTKVFVNDVATDPASGPENLIQTTTALPNRFIGSRFGSALTEPIGARHFRVGLKRSVPIGTILTAASEVSVSVLKPTAVYPGDPNNENDWIKADWTAGAVLNPEPISGSQEYGAWVLPQVVFTRAIRFTKVVKASDSWGMAYLAGVYVFSERYNNIAPQATVYATSNNGAVGAINNRIWEPFAGRWDNGASGGPNVISVSNPEKLTFVWPTNVTLAGLATHSTGFRDGKVQRFIGPPDHHPRDAADNEWETVKTFADLKFNSFTEFGLTTIEFGGAATARAFRIVIEKAADPALEPVLGSTTFGGKRVFVNEVFALFPLGTDSIAASIVTRGCDLPAPIPLNFHLDQPGYVTLVIENEQGVRVRNLVAETFYPAGDHLVYWDGLDESRKVNLVLDGVYDIEGALVPSGNYTLRGLVRDELNLRYEFTVNSSGSPPWQSSDSKGGWLSDHRPPSDIVYLPGSNELMIVCETGESSLPGLYVDLNGKKKSGIGVVEDGFFVASHLSQDRGPLADPAVITYSAVMSKSRLMVHSIDAGKNFTRLVRLNILSGEATATTNVLNGFAVYNKTALVSIAASNAITVIDTTTRKVIGTIAVPSPRGMAFDSLGRLLVLSGNSLLRSTLPFAPVAPFTLATDTLLNGSLDDPRRITVHASTGNLYISQWGNSHNVKVFSFLGPLIQPLRTIGDTSPLGIGLYNTNQMHNPSGVCITPDNKVWVAEYDMAPKRVSVWSLEGTLQKAFYGPPKYGGGGRLDPQDKSRFYYADSDKDDPVPFYIGMEWKLNWEDGTSYLKSVYARWSTNNSDAFLKVYPPETPVRMAGREYMINTWNSAEVTGSTGGVGIWERVGEEIKMRGYWGVPPSWPILMEPAYKAKLPPGLNSEEAYVLWSDANGDYRVQPSEITYRPGSASTFQVQPNLDLTTLTGLRVPLLGISANGAPLYNLAGATNFAAAPPVQLTSGGCEIVQASNGRYVLTGGPIRGYQDGKELWYYHSRWPGLHASHVTPASTIPKPPGLMIGTTRLLGPHFAPNGGEAGELWAINGNKGEIYLLTTDGLFVSTLFHDSRDHGGWSMPSLARNGLVNDLTLDEESFWPSITKTEDGNIYLIAGKNHSGVVRLEGLDSVRRIPAIPFAVTTGQLAACVQYQVELAACQINSNPEHIFVPIGTVAPTLDGNLSEWASTNFVAIDSKATGAVQIANGKLYAAWSTESAAIADNTGLLPNALFKTGGALDLMIGVDASAPLNRSTAVLGDMRLIIARVNGATKALLYRQVAASGTPVTFTSPVRSLDIADIQDVSADVQFAGAGGRFEISIPLTRLGLNPSDGLVIKGDIGILRGINGIVAQRSYWHNEATGLVNDTPTEAELEPSLWGRWEFHGQMAAPINITTAGALPDGQIVAAYSQTFAASGGAGGFAWSLVSGALPPGLTLSAQGGLTGTPLLPGNYAFTLRATDSASATLDKAFALKINALALNISTAALPGGQVGSGYTSTLALSGGLAPFTWSLDTGTLPAGLNISPAGVISGTPITPGTFNFQIKLVDFVLVTATRQFSITVLQPLAIVTGTPLTAGKSGDAYALTLSATGGAGGNSWSISSGALPAGLTLTSAGILSGTPTVSGNFSFTFRVADSAGGIQTKAVTLAIAPTALVITTASPAPTGTQNSPYSMTFAATGGAGGNTWALASGALPPGLNLSAAGLLNGTPTAAGNFDFSVRVTDSASATLIKAFTLKVNALPLVILTSTLPGGLVGTAYNSTLGQTGGLAPFIWSLDTGTLPTGLNISAAGVISGTPTTPGTFTFQIKIIDAALTSATRPLSITVLQPLAIATGTPLTAGKSGDAYSLTLAATGGAGGNSWSISSGALPAGLTLTSAGILSGTPTVSGNFSFTIRVADSAGGIQTKAVTLAIAPTTLVITTASPAPNGTQNSPYSLTFAATGGAGGNTWALASGVLPPGLNLSDAGLLNGTPTAAGNFDFSVRVTDSASATVTKAFTLKVNALPLVISTSTLPGGLVGTAYNSTLGQTGGLAPFNWSLDTGTLPTGLNISAAGVMSGTPTTPGTFNFQIKIIDAALTSATRPLSIAVLQPLAIATGTPLTAGNTGVAYSLTLSATGGAGGDSWSISSGALPAGLTLTTAGLLNGTPTVNGNFSFTIRVADSAGGIQTKPVTLFIAAPALLISTASTAPNGTQNSPYSLAFAATGGAGGNTWTLASGTLPPGLNLSPAGLLNGTPTTSGAFNFSVQVADSAAASATKTISLTIAPPLLAIVQFSPVTAAQTGVPYTFAFTATGGTGGNLWIVSAGALPSGLTLSSQGLLSGSPTVAGTFLFSVRVTDSSNTSKSRSFSLTITPGTFSITSADPLPPAAMGFAYNINLAANGGSGGNSWSLASGTLPAGLTLSTAGALAGIPTVFGDFALDLKVTDTAAASATKTFNLSIAPPPLEITSASPLTGGQEGVDFSFAFVASGGAGANVWSLADGAIPPGLTLGDSGILAGVPTQSGSFNFAIQVVDATPTTNLAVFALQIAPPGLAILTSALPNATLSNVYTAALVASGGVPPYSWTIISGSAPPAGLAMSNSGEFTGAPTEFGTFNFTVEVTDSAAASVAGVVSIQVLNPVRITTSSAPMKAAKAFPFAQQLAAAGGVPPYTWSVVSGALPTGLALNASGLLAGTAKSDAPAAFTVLVADSLSATTTKDFAIEITAPLGFLTESLPGGMIATEYSQSLQTTGGLPSITFSVTAGSLPPGLALNPANGALSGTPTLTGTFPFTVTALDGTFQFVSRNYGVDIALTPLAVTTASLPHGSRNVPYTQKLTASGGLPSYFWTLKDGTLPPGLNISSAGAIFGAPTAEGTFNFTLGVSDRLLTNATQSMVLTIDPSSVEIQSGTLAITTGPQLASNPVNLALVRAFAATGGTAPYTWSVVAGFIPPGCGFAASGNLVGAPNAVGDYGFTVRVKDAAQNIFYKDFKISVTPGSPSTVGGGSLPLAVATEPYTALVVASGGIPPFKWSVSSGALPPGLAVASSLGATGLVTGVPLALGSFGFTLAATDALNKTALINAVLVITNAPLVIASSILPAGDTTNAYVRALLATKGVPPYTWSIAEGSLPPGLELSAGGILSGTPTAPGLFNFTVGVSDQVSSNATQAFFIDVGGSAPVSPRDAWRTEKFGPDALAEITADEADPDGDGLVNIVEYALGLDPNAASTDAQRPRPQVQTIEGKKYLTLTYTKAAGAADVLVIIETTDSVGPTAIWTANIVEVTRSGDGVETITVRDTVSLDEAAARFLRLTVKPEQTSP